MRILYNAHIYAPQTPTAVAIEHGEILAVGKDTPILSEYGWKADIQDMAGCTLWPGLVDAHVHLHQYALSLQRINCETGTLASCLERVVEKSRNSPGGTWILGHGWNHNVWPEGLGNAAMLDAIAPRQPVYLTAKSLHAAWANHAALNLAGINPQTPDPENGLIERDSRGNPTGILFETAMDLVAKIIPSPTPGEIETAIENAQDTLLSMGLTGIHDFDGSACFDALQKLHQSGRLKIRIIKAIHPQDLDYAISLGLRSHFGDDRLRIGPLKLFADGALGPQTAAMLLPYDGDPSNTGLLALDAEEIQEIGQRAVQNGFNLAIHAIGDRANHAVLDAYARLRDYEKGHHLPDLRHRIEHVQLIDPLDQGRLASLNIIASMQPSHAPSDMEMADRYWGARSSNAYAWQSLRQKGARLAFGSDTPVESPDPFQGLHAAVTRCRQDGRPSENGWYPEQRLSLSDALYAFTQGAAYAAGLEHSSGVLAPHQWADLIALQEDPFKVPARDLYHVKPVATMIGGEWVWQT